jgi:hypothetical protein
MTGRAAGYCTGNEMPGFANPGGCGMGFRRGMGRGFGGGWGRGGGRGWRNRFHATGLTGWQRAAMGWFGPAEPQPLDTRQELSVLQQQARQMEGALDQLRRRMAQLQEHKDD